MTTWDWPLDFDTRLAASSEVRAVLDYAGAIAEAGAIRRCPVDYTDDDPTHLRDSIHRNHGVDTLGGYCDVIADAKTPEGVEYGLTVELGTRPHTIVTPTGKRIRHPGTPAQPFLRPALDDVRGAL